MYNRQSVVVFDGLRSEVLIRILIWVFPKIGVPQNGWFIMTNPIKMDDLAVALFLETSISVLGVITLKTMPPTQDAGSSPPG